MIININLLITLSFLPVISLEYIVIKQFDVVAMCFLWTGYPKVDVNLWDAVGVMTPEVLKVLAVTGWLGARIRMNPEAVAMLAATGPRDAMVMEMLDAVMSMVTVAMGFDAMIIMVPALLSMARA